MHPPLHPEAHPHCKQQIYNLVECHSQHRIAKFLGACNEQKWALDRCFREEKKIRRAVSMEKARKDKERLVLKAQQKQANLEPLGATLAEQ